MRLRSPSRLTRVPIFLSFLAVAVPSVATEKEVTYHFSHLAGSLVGGPGSTDGPALRAQFHYPAQIARDSAGNLYVADDFNHTIRKITPLGNVVTIAGRAGEAGFVDGPASLSRFNRPQGIAVDAHSNIYVADYSNNCIRKIGTDGVVSTIAGQPGTYGRVDGRGSAARFSGPNYLLLAPDGKIYVSDFHNSAIRQITDGNLVSTRASFSSTPLMGLAVDPSGNLYTAAHDRFVIYQFPPSGGIVVYAGKENAEGNIDGPAATARFTRPNALAADNAGNLFVAQEYAIRKISPLGQVTTLAGSFTEPGDRDGAGTAARLHRSVGMLVEPSGEVIFTDGPSHLVRKLSNAGVVSTVAGARLEEDPRDGPGPDARFHSPWKAAVASDGTVFVTDAYASRIRQISPSGYVSTLAGERLGYHDGVGSAAEFYLPRGIVEDRDGTLLVCEAISNTIRRVTRSGEVTTYAGNPFMVGATDGPVRSASFNEPSGLAVDSQGNVFVADRYNHTIRKISPSGIVTTFAGQAGAKAVVDGTGPEARLYEPYDLAIDSKDNLYVGEPAAVRKITPAGVVSTMAGSSPEGLYQGDPRLWVIGLAVSPDDEVFITDGFTTFSKISPDGQVSIVWGNSLDSGDRNGEGSQARFASPRGLTFDSRGNVYICDYGNRAIRKGVRIVKDPNATLRLAALSARCRAGSGDQTLIVGFVVDGADGKDTLLRGIGPTLAPLGVSNAMSDPRLQLFRLTSQGAALTAENDNWGGSSALSDRFVQLGAQPPLPADSKDAALLTTVQSGVYTAHLSSTSGQSGIALVEAYDADPSSAARFAALSTRTVAGTGDDTLIAGFVLEGSGTKNLLLRAVGPSLVKAGVPASSVLQNPTLKLYRMSGTTSTLVAENDDWSGSAELKDTFTTVGAGALDSDASKDAALLVNLEPGVYTAHVSSGNAATGVALIEIFDVP